MITIRLDFWALTGCSFAAMSIVGWLIAAGSFIALSTVARHEPTAVEGVAVGTFIGLFADGFGRLCARWSADRTSTNPTEGE